MGRETINIQMLNITLSKTFVTQKNGSGSEKCRIVVTGKVVKASVKLRSAGGEGLSQGNSIRGRRNSHCKGPEAELCPVWLWNREERWEWEKRGSKCGRARSLGLVGLVGPSEGFRFCSKHACGCTQDRTQHTTATQKTLAEP